MFNGDGRRNALNPIYLRLVHAIKELARVRRESLDIATLSLGEKRVESQRTFARTAQSGDGDEFAFGQIEIKILKIMVPYAA